MIDYNLLEMTDIDSDSKIIIAKVISLNQLEGKCYITNGALCKMLGLKNKATASRKISKLVKIGYLSFYQKSGGKRYLYPTQKLVDAMLTTKLITNDDDFDEMGNPILVNGVSQNESIGYTNLSQESILNSVNRVSQNQSTPYPNLSQPSISTNISEEYITEVHQSTIPTNTSLSKKQFEKEHILSLLKEKFEDGLASIIQRVVEGGSITSKERTTLNENSSIIFKKLPALKNYIEEVL